MASFGFRGNEKKHRFSGRVGFGGEPKDETPSCVNKEKVFETETKKASRYFSFGNKIPKVKKQTETSIAAKPREPEKESISIPNNTEPKSNTAVVTITMKNSLFKRVLSNR
jgi:hypothetical protein